MPTPAKPAPEEKTLVLRLHNQTAGTVSKIPLRPPTAEEAIRWSLTVRERRSWEWNATERVRIEGEIDGLLDRLGVAFSMQPQIGAAEHLEIGIPYQAGQPGLNPAALMPWEYLLTRVTADYRHDRPVAVTRYLMEAPELGRPRDYMKRLAFVGSAPSWLATDIVSFEREYRLIENSLGARVASDGSSQVAFCPNRLPDPECEAAEIYHFSGFDTHEAWYRAGEGQTIEDWSTAGPAAEDGFVLPKECGVAACPAQSLAGLFGRTVFPQLVSFGTYDSAASMAPAMVIGGALASVGLQDYVDDTLLEDFWARFYQALAAKELGELDGFAITEAYRQAVFEQMLEHGGECPGVVLWTRNGVGAGRSGAKRQRFVETLQQERIGRLNAGLANRDRLSSGGWSSAITVVVEPLKSVNYSLLHNQEPIFEEFRLQCSPELVLSGLLVEVALNAGQEDCRCSFVVNTDKIWVDLAKDIKIPLTASLLRTLLEGLRSTITTRVSIGDRTLYQRVFPITLLAIDEWRDDANCKRFLPSFILPRDPAIRRIITEALPILRALQDDPHAAFRGYTGITENPELAMQQAQAIWVALGYVRKLNYINPPPSYERGAQRIRFPRDVLADGRGTCLDLALLLAACFEYADLFPVVFLISGHAFVGFWREPQRRYEMLNPAERHIAEAGEVIGMDMRLLRPVRRWSPWMWEACDHEFLFQSVVAGSLIALESTFLTGPRSFREAVSAGLGNLRSYRQFDCALDIAAARTNGVTPIPLPEREA